MPTRFKWLHRIWVCSVFFHSNALQYNAESAPSLYGSFQSASSSLMVITMITMMIRNGMTFCMGSLASSSSNNVLQMAKQLKSRSTHFERYIFEVHIIKVRTWVENIFCHQEWSMIVRSKYYGEYDDNDDEDNDVSWDHIRVRFVHLRNVERLEQVSITWNNIMMMMMMMVMMMMMMMMLICICHLIYSYFFQGPVAVLQSLELNKCWFY